MPYLEAKLRTRHHSPALAQLKFESPRALRWQEELYQLEDLVFRR